MNEYDTHFGSERSQN